MNKLHQSLDTKSHLLDQIFLKAFFSRLCNIKTQSDCFLSLSCYYCYCLAHLDSSLSLPKYWHSVWISLIPIGGEKSRAKKISAPYTTHAAKTHQVSCIKPCCLCCCKTWLHSMVFCTQINKVQTTSKPLS